MAGCGAFHRTLMERCSQTALTESDRDMMRLFFVEFAGLLYNVVVPGAHVFVAYAGCVWCTPSRRALRNRLCASSRRCAAANRNAEKEYPGVNVMPRSSWEPWGLFRSQLRVVCKTTFGDGVQYPTSPARGLERKIGPSVDAGTHAASACTLPLGEGVVLDPSWAPARPLRRPPHLGFVASGSKSDFFRLAETAIPLAELRREDFDSTVALPGGLTIAVIRDRIYRARSW